MPRTITNRPTPLFERVAATVAGLVIIFLVVFLLIRNEPIADPRLFFGLRVVLSLSAAVFGATIPGFFNIEWSGRGFVVRAGGALGLFFLTFIYTPDLAAEQCGTTGQIYQESSGKLSPPIACNSGTIKIEGDTISR